MAVTKHSLSDYHCSMLESCMLSFCNRKITDYILHIIVHMSCTIICIYICTHIYIIYVYIHTHI